MQEKLICIAKGLDHSHQIQDPAIREIEMDKYICELNQLDDIKHR